MTRGRMTWTMPYYLNDDNGNHDQQSDDVYKKEDDLDDAFYYLNDDNGKHDQPLEGR